MKRLFAIILLSVLFCASAFAYDFSAVCESGQTLYYNITSDVEPYTVEVTSELQSYPYYTTYIEGDIIIPESVVYNGITYSVTGIGTKAFYDCMPTSVIIPNSITRIGNYAFFWCSGISFLTIPNSVIEIGDNAFYHCSGLTAITIPNSVLRIGDYAFEGCSNMTSATIPDTLTNIGDFAFNYCDHLTEPLFNSKMFVYFPKYSSIIEYEIPEGIQIIVGGAFESCSYVRSITIPNS
ncbi:MAG: leucine-rich repeat domain-containing protein, partial [Bacteroidales bacterium]|nr:leucine-rich repeat domain-containing protein [Bacteroidales bacterium]